MAGMRVTHLDCGHMRPPFLQALPANVFLVDPGAGSALVLVDTGFGLLDARDPGYRIGPIRHLLRPEFNDANTAIGHLERLGHSADEVGHIVLTHLDVDHAGGLADFPNATVHTTADEHAAAISDPDFRDKTRYRPGQFAHGPRWNLHAGPGDPWREGLTGHEVLPGITLVPMPGHSRGHAAVAVQTSDAGLLVHAGDAVFDARSFADRAADGSELTSNRLLRAFEQIAGRDRAAIARNHESLRRLHASEGVTVINAHDARSVPQA
jgi:glyoxylase-like metal-dependent hydrolase (beta-lactamase superfamily II)